MSSRRADLAPINALPPEILARIFALSKPYCCRLPLGKLSFYKLTAVCARWRQLAIDTASLWTHIDIGPVTPTSLTRLLLERTRDTPVHIHVYDEPSDLEYLMLDPRTVIPLLEPHIHRVYSIDLESFSPSAGFVSSLLDLWLDRGSAHSPGSLLIRRPCANSLLLVDKKDKPGTQAKQPNKILQSLRTLHLWGVILPWDSGAYHNLTDLRLSGWKRSVRLSVSDLAGILSASPTLVILKLGYITITGTDGWNQAVPTTLSSLKVLDLVRLKADSLTLLLPLIAFPQPSNDLSVGLPADEETPNILEAFFVRVCMQTLYYYHRKGARSPNELLLKLPPRIDVLILEEFYILDGQATQTNSAASQTPLPPRLPTVVLVWCLVTFEGLRDLVAQHRVQRLRLDLCSILNSTPANSRSSLEVTRSSLLEVYPALECTISEHNSTWMLPVRKWDDYW
ncbi:hypothetical protein FRC08_013571 [Ceratobasidium sp. 394]|nr:hypothetical protein FRC08_013571 [Ceratobasidium sp. 394]